MTKKKSSYSADFKAKVSMAAIKEEFTMAQLTSKYEVHTTQIRNWKTQAVEAVKSCFRKKKEAELADQEKLVSGLYEQIGRLQTELNWLKKKMWV